MLTVKSRRTTAKDTAEFATATLNTVGQSLRDGTGKELAVHDAGMWQATDGSTYVSLTIADTVDITFENPQFGEVERVTNVSGVQLIDSALWGGAGEYQLIAIYDDALDAWHLRIKPGVLMPLLTIAPAGTASVR